MHHGISAPVFGSLHARTQFGFRVLRRIEWVVMRCNPAAGHQLDLACAQHQLLTHPAKHLIGAIGNHGSTHFFRIA